MDDEKEFEPTVIELLSVLTDTVDRIELGQFALTDRVGRLEVGQEQLRADLSEVKSDVFELKADVGSLKADVGSLKADVGSLKAEFKNHRLETNERFDSLGETFVDYVSSMDDRVLILENR